MPTITINELKNDYIVKLHKANETVISEIPFDYVDSMKHDLCDIKENLYNINCFT